MKNLILFVTLAFSACGGIETQQQPIENPSPEEYKPYLPENLNWCHIDTNNDGVYENYCPPLKNQIGGSCVLYSEITTLQIQYSIDHKLLTTIELSSQNVFNCTRQEVFDPNQLAGYLTQYGVMERKYSPDGLWLPSECNNCMKKYPTEWGMTPMSEMVFYGASKINRENGMYLIPEQKRINLMALLASGPVRVGIDRMSDMMPVNGDKNTLQCRVIKPHGSGHSLSIVGYEDNGKVFLAANSWGGSKLTKIIFDGSDKCGFWRDDAIQFSNTWARPGTGQKYCYTVDDTDKDGINNANDNCPYAYNPDQKNYDGDLLGDACDPTPDSSLQELLLSSGNPWVKSSRPTN